MARRDGRERDPVREKSWRRTIRQQPRSGLTVRAFCLRQGLKVGAFRSGGRLCPAMSADARPRAGQAHDCAALSHVFPCCGLIADAALTGRLPCSAAF